MKVRQEQEDERYKPIIIKLETGKEAELLTHTMNCGSGMNLNDYADARNIDLTQLQDFTHDLWKKLNELTRVCR